MVGDITMLDFSESEELEAMHSFYSLLYELGLGLSAIMALLVVKGIVTNEEILTTEEEVAKDPRMKFAFDLLDT